MDLDKASNIFLKMAEHKFVWKSSDGTSYMNASGYLHDKQIGGIMNATLIGQQEGKKYAAYVVVKGGTQFLGNFKKGREAAKAIEEAYLKLLDI